MANDNFKIVNHIKQIHSSDSKNKKLLKTLSLVPECHKPKMSKQT